jgi:Uncharacterized protein conserved in bacteria (DUF2188)
MAKLPKFTVSKDEKKDKWVLTEDTTGKVKKTFGTKAELTAGGVLEKAVGADGGSVKIQKENGRFQEERTYPGSRDPKQSPG